MKTKMGFRHKFAYSFFNFAAYKKFLVQGLGKSILYIFLVTLIFSTITNINTIDNFNSDISNVEATFIHDASNFELKNGLLSVDSNEPIYYKHDGEVLIVDTSGKTSSSALDSYSNGVYMDSNILVIRQKYNTIQTINFTDFSEFIVTNKTIEDTLSMAKIIFPIILLILNPIISFLVNLISGFLILGPISLFISSFIGVKLNYSKACTLSFYAMTLPLLLESLLNISGIVFPEFFAVFYVVALIYCGLAIKELKNTDKSNLNLTK